MRVAWSVGLALWPGLPLHRASDFGVWTVDRGLWTGARISHKPRQSGENRGGSDRPYARQPRLLTPHAADVMRTVRQPMRFARTLPSCVAAAERAKACSPHGTEH